MSRMWRIGWLLLMTAGCAHNAQTAPRREVGVAQDVTPGALASRGLALLQHGDYLRAEQYLQLALRAGHPERPLIVPLLTTCIASSRLRAALMHADRHLARYPDNWRARFVKAALLRALGDVNQAEHEQARALADAPRAAQAELAQGVAP